MIIQNLSEENSLLHHFLGELRNQASQKDQWRFRKNMELIGNLVAYEFSKHLSYENKTIQTPLAAFQQRHLKSEPVLLSIMRAALPFYQGVQDVFREAPSGFIGAYRSPAQADGSFSIMMDYLACPPLEDKDWILIDPMIATGKSLVKTIKNLKEKMGKPKNVYILAIISAPEGIDHIKSQLPEVKGIWSAAVDQGLNEKYYIVPGLGDAGDLAFGPKH